jgi:uncharacterized protein YdbL (DUF1318 family)
MGSKAVAAAALAIIAAGCIQVRTESEIKPIHITMDVNLKVDKELDRAFADEKEKKPQGDFAKVKEILDRKVAGITSMGMIEPREGATDDDRIFLAESNARRRKRYEEVASSSGVSLETVQRRKASKMIANVPAGSGVWCQADDGTWAQK